jgi:hypothetical protein
MSTHEFVNRVRSLYHIDQHQLPELTDDQWRLFRENPPRFLFIADKRQIEAIMREVEKRQ